MQTPALPPDLAARYPGAIVFRFGDTPELVEHLTGLVLSGAKRATCEALSVFESGAERMPELGGISIAVDWDGRPMVVIETTDLSVRRFDEVDEDFALAEGENADLAGWRADHQAYFERSAGFSPDMALLCERFRVVEVLER